MKKMMTQSMKRKIPCGFIAAAFAMTLAMTNGCGDGGGGSWTPAEKAEVDKYIREYGRDAMVQYLSTTTEKDEQPDLKYIKYFVSQGANVNAKDDDGKTSLHFAARESNIEVIKFLVYKGADVNAKTRGEATPLHGAAIRGNVEVVKFLVSKGADVNAKTSGEAIPLHGAASWGNVEVVQFLLSKGADVNAKNDNGKTPADMARGNDEIIKILKGGGGAR